jgi:hypothetical protein
VYAPGSYGDQGQRVNVVEADALIPAVKALVGTTEWVNFTDQKINIDIAE